MLKVDEYGCLVPDCQNIIIDDTSEEESIGFELKMFPNPTKDLLNVFVRIQQGNKKINFPIFDSMGKEQKSFTSFHQEETLMINVQAFPKGIYFLEGRYYIGRGVVLAYLICLIIFLGWFYAIFFFSSLPLGGTAIYTSSKFTVDVFMTN